MQREYSASQYVLFLKLGNLRRCIGFNNLNKNRKEMQTVLILNLRDTYCSTCN